MYNIKFLEESNFPITSNTFDMMQKSYQQTAQVLSGLFGLSFFWLKKPTTAEEGVLVASGVPYRIEAGDPASDKYTRDVRKTAVTLENGTSADLIEETYYKKDSSGSDFSWVQIISNASFRHTGIKIDGSQVATSFSANGISIYGDDAHGTLTIKKTHTNTSNERKVVYDIKTQGITLTSSNRTIQCTLSNNASRNAVVYLNRSTPSNVDIQAVVNYTHTGSIDFDVDISIF